MRPSSVLWRLPQVFAYDDIESSPVSVEGIWGLRFVSLSGKLPVPELGGVVIFETGRILGGDSWSYYTGEYQVEGNLLAFRLNTRVHSAEGGHSVFGGPVRQLSFAGKAFVDEEQAAFGATMVVDHVPDLRLLARLTKIQAIKSLRL
jgi:hypothetical protein